MTTTVFNVGGKVFEISNSLLNKYPDSKLAILTSEKNKHRKPIFLDHNPDVFQVLMDYHRYGELLIPDTISKQAVQIQFREFGIPYPNVHERGTSNNSNLCQRSPLPSCPPAYELIEQIPPSGERVQTYDLPLSERARISETEKINQLSSFLTQRLKHMASKGTREGLLCLSEANVPENTLLQYPDNNEADGKPTRKFDFQHLLKYPPEWIQLLSAGRVSSQSSMPYSTFTVSSTLSGGTSDSPSLDERRLVASPLPDLQFILQPGILPQLEKGLLIKTLIEKVQSHVWNNCTVRVLSEFGLFESVCCTVVVIYVRLLSD